MKVTRLRLKAAGRPDGLVLPAGNCSAVPLVGAGKLLILEAPHFIHSQRVLALSVLRETGCSPIISTIITIPLTDAFCKCVQVPWQQC